MNQMIIKGIAGLAFIFLSHHVFSQDILYLRNTGATEAEILDFDGKTIIFRLPGESESNKHYISKSELDSMHYREKTEFFLARESDVKQPVFYRNWINMELINSFSGKVNVEYGRISANGNSMFTAGLLINVKEDDPNYWYDYYGWFDYTSYSPYYFFVRTGFDFFPFDHSPAKANTAKFSTGFFLHTGAYRKQEYVQYDYGYPPAFKIKPEFKLGLFWNLSGRYYVTENLQVNAGVDISILPLLTFICPRIGLAFGFK